MKYHELLKHLELKRLQHPLPNAAIARHLGVSYNSILNWERGICNPSALNLLDWCEFFGVNVRFEIDDATKCDKMRQ